MLLKFSQIVNQLYAFIYETNHSKSGLRLPSIVALGRTEKAFFTGLKKFVEHYKPLLKNYGNIKCPCKSCRNVSFVSIKNLSQQIVTLNINGQLTDVDAPPNIIDVDEDDDFIDDKDVVPRDLADSNDEVLTNDDDDDDVAVVYSSEEED
ncbi:SRP72 RNA-binding domain-containing protein [Tanacetum coccineum]|uniref:SRP72 RNA-binding domain-containing protein n=1 Tax=Tanacetum coccineum TaxID=301880 RepID=A0ABQ4YR33_9ASTR